MPSALTRKYNGQLSLSIKGRTDLVAQWIARGRVNDVRIGQDPAFLADTKTRTSRSLSESFTFAFEVDAGLARRKLKTLGECRGTVTHWA